MEKTMKKPIALLLVLVMVMSVIPFLGDSEVFAAEPVVGPINLSNDENTSGPGYEWNCSTRIITLSGIDLQTAKNPQGGDSYRQRA